MKRVDIVTKLFADKAAHSLKDVRKTYIRLVDANDIVVRDKQGYSHALRVDISSLYKQGIISKVHPGTKDALWQMR